MKNICIIGAGPAGLAAAYELNNNGQKCQVFEADRQPGGIAKTSIYKNYRADLGGHRFFTKNPNINSIWKQVMQDDFMLRSRLSRIVYNKQFYNYPLKIKNVLGNLGLIESALMLFSYAAIKVKPPAKIETFEDWVTSKFGRRLFLTFFKTYTEKVWGIPCNEISADWAAQRIKNLSFRQAVKNAILSGRPSNSKVITSLIEQFHYPRLGPGMMWERLSEELIIAGNEVAFQHKISRITHHDKIVDKVIVHSPQGETKILVDHIISSMPLTELILSLYPKPPQNVIEAANSLSYRDFIAVNVILNEKNIFPDNWIYIHDPDVEMGRIQNYKNWSPDMVPDPNKTVLGLEYFLFSSDEEWQWDDAKLLDRGMKELEILGFSKAEQFADGWVVRVPKAYPTYDENYQQAVTTIQEYLKDFKNLQTIGRNGLHRYNNMDHSMLTGIYAAQKILGEEYNVWSVNTEEDYHETDKELEQAIQSVEQIIDPVANGVAFGTSTALLLFVITLITLFSSESLSGEYLALLNQFFFHYSISWQGAIIIFFESAIFGFILGALLAWLRNTFSEWFVG